MKKDKKTVYVLEGRKSKSENDLMPNRTTNTIGIFSSVKKAVKWMEKNGSTFYGKPKSYKYFWALLEGRINDDDSPDLHNFYTLDGKVI